MHAHVCKSVYLSALAHHSCFVFDCVPAFLQRVHNADVPFGSRVNERAGVCVCVCLCVSVCVCGGGFWCCASVGVWHGDAKGCQFLIHMSSAVIPFILGVL